jgi:hypothetical protein
MDEELKLLKEAIEQKLKGAVSKEDIETLKAEFKIQIEGIKTGISDEELKAAKSEFDEKLKAQWTEVEKMSKKNEDEKPLSFGDRIKAAFVSAGIIKSTTENGRTFDAVELPKDVNQKVTIKAAFDMNTAGTTTSVATGLQTNYGMQMEKIPASNEVNLLDVFPHMPLAPIERYMAKVVEYEETDGAAIKTETTSAGDSSFKLKTEDYKVFDYAVKFRVHRNLIRTWVGLQQRIQTIGMDRLMNKIGRFVIDKLAAGDGSATPYGMLSTGKYTAYDLTLRAGEVQKANIVDVIKNGVLQEQLIGTATEVSTKSVDAILLNPVDIAELESLKDANDNSIRLSGLVVDATGKLSYIYGLRVISKKYIATNTFILFNQTNNPSVEIGDKFDLQVIIGYDKSEDLSKGILTIQLETEMGIGLGDPETIIYCSDIADAASKLTTMVG